MDEHRLKERGATHSVSSFPGNPQEGIYQEWIAPEEDADRAPCPALNTLANHGYLNRNGRNITTNELSLALREIFGLGDSAIGFLVKAANVRNVWGNIDLNSLRVHNYIEHDASLVHKDTIEGPNWIVDQDRLEGFMRTAVVFNV